MKKTQDMLIRRQHVVPAPTPSAPVVSQESQQLNIPGLSFTGPGQSGLRSGRSLSPGVRSTRSSSGKREREENDSQGDNNDNGATWSQVVNKKKKWTSKMKQCNLMKKWVKMN